MGDTRGRWLWRAQVALAGSLALGVGAVLAEAAFRAPDVAFIWSRGTPWIGPRMVPHTAGKLVNESSIPHAVFERHFTAEVPRGSAMLRVRALRDLVLSVNGHEVPFAARDPQHWKEAVVVDIAPLIVAGDNVLRAGVRNPDGVALLQLRVDGLSSAVVTDEQWLAAWEGEPLAPAAIADDGLRLPDSTERPQPLAELQHHALALLALAASGVLLFLGMRRWPGAATRSREVAFALVAIFWVWLFVAKIVRIPKGSGFDAAYHLSYVASLMHEKTLPLATEGFQTYQPPLYYVVTALLLAVTNPTPGSVAERAVFSLLPALSGLGMTFVAAGMARLLFPQWLWLQAGTIVIAGLLPMSLTLASGASNEAPHALFASLALLVTVRALLRKTTTRQDDYVLGLFLGLALLTKYTSAILVPTTVGMVAVRRWIVERWPASRIAAGAARASVVVVALAGWFYVRNYLYFGEPFVWSLSAWSGKTIWQYPGFHTPSYFLRFGDALTQPWYSGFHSFWDSLYTTLWGDGMGGGALGAAYFHGHWRYDWMAALFLLALPATGFLIVGWIRVLRNSLENDDLGRRLALSLLVVLPPLLVASLMNVNLRWPFWSFGKAFYALFLTPTLALLVVLGFDALDGVLARRAPTLVRALPFGWAAAFLGSVVLAYAG